MELAANVSAATLFEVVKFYSRQVRVTGRNRVINSEVAERGENDANSVASPTTVLAMLRRLLTFVAGSWCLTTCPSSLVREIATVGALLLVPVPPLQVTPRHKFMYLVICVLFE